MTKAEELGKEYAENVMLTVDHRGDVEDAFIDGDEQAEEDNELTWEDMRELHIIFAEVDAEIELCKTDIKSETIGYYQEVLKRFNKERKGK